MAESKNGKNPTYIVRLSDDEESSNTYRVEKELYFQIKEMLKPYKSYKAMPKKVRCIETKEIFKSAKHANFWLVQNGVSRNDSGGIMIKSACNKKRDTAYGYHWEFVE